MSAPSDLRGGLSRRNIEAGHRAAPRVLASRPLTTVRRYRHHLCRDRRRARIRAGPPAPVRAVSNVRRRALRKRAPCRPIITRGVKGVMERMRHVRIAGLALVVVLALSALLAGTASASKSAWDVFQNCPLKTPGLTACTYAKSGAGSYFQAGKITIQLTKPITLYGGAIENEETYAEQYVGPEHGNSALTPKAQPAPV